MTRWRDLLHPGDADDFFCRRPLPPFNPATRAYSRANARWLAELSRLVYRHDAEEDELPRHPTQARLLQGAGCTRRTFFFAPETDTQAMLVEFDHAAPFAALVFRGTELHLKDFITDLDIGRIKTADGEIEAHPGFQRALDSVWQDIKPALLRLGCPVFYAGHSLGAALATLAAARHAPAALYTFGSPRVGDADFAASLAPIADRIHRIVYGNDIVASLPPEALGFRHVGALRHLTAPSANRQLAWLDGWLQPPPAMADHAPIHYVDHT